MESFQYAFEVDYPFIPSPIQLLDYPIHIDSKYSDAIYHMINFRENTSLLMLLDVHGKKVVGTVVQPRNPPDGMHGMFGKLEFAYQIGGAENTCSEVLDMAVINNCANLMGLVTHIKNHFRSATISHPDVVNVFEKLSVKTLMSISLDPKETRGEFRYYSIQVMVQERQ